MKEIRELGLIVGVSVLLGLVLAIAAGIAVAQTQSADLAFTFRLLGNIGAIILALFTLVFTLVWAAIYGGLAFAIGRWGPKGPAAIRWAGSKIGRIDAVVDRGSDDYVVRPLARASHGVAAAGAFAGGLRRPLDAGGAGGRWSHEITRWRTFANRVRGRVTD